jgi:alanine racemase
MTRPTYANINLSAFKANYDLASRLAGDATCVAVIKANGYGHGICQIAKALPETTLAVACVDEAMALRSDGINNPIMVLEGFFDVEELLLAVAHKLQLIIHSEYQVNLLSEYSVANQNIGIWLKLNTGMNRLGFNSALTEAVLSRLKSSASVELLGVMTHFSCADEIDKSHTEKQISTFRAAIDSLSPSFEKLWLSASNSAGLIGHKNACFDLVRPGIMLYGSSPFDYQSAEALGLQAVMTLESKIMAIHELKAGDCVGYGKTWCASRDTRVATIAIGYGDGYPRHAPMGTPVWVGDRVVPLVGRVSMDMLAVDLTYHPDAQVGDLVELWGANVSVDEVAKAAETISYELLTGVTSRVPRRYL